MSDIKNIIIIGASTAGHGLANALVPILPGTHRILLIDSAAQAYHPLASLRAAVVPGWEDKVVIPLSTGTVFQAGTAHRVIAPNKVVQLKKGSVVLEKEWEGATEIPFDKCVLALGAAQPYPMRSDPKDSIEEVKSKLRGLQTEVGKATKVVIIGAGPVGLEFAGEVRDKHPDTEITLVHSLPHVLNPAPAGVKNTNPTGSGVQSWNAPYTNLKLSTTVEKALQSLKIDFVPNTKIPLPADGFSAGPGAFDGKTGYKGTMQSVTTSNGKVIEGDFWFVGIGNKSNTSVVSAADSGAVNGGLVTVDEYLKVSSPTAGSVFDGNYYAIGDCTNTPGWKTNQTAASDAEGLAPILVAHLKGTKAKPHARPTMHAIVIPLGSTRAPGYITFPFMGDTFMPEFMLKKAKAEKLFTDMFAASFKGSEKVTN